MTRCAVIFHYEAKDKRSSHITRKFTRRSINNLHACGVERIIVKDDGSNPSFKSESVEILRTEHEGINAGIKRIATMFKPEDSVMLVDPHNIYNHSALTDAYNILSEPESMAILQLGIATRIKHGPWTTVVTDLWNNGQGTWERNMSVILKQPALVRYVDEYLGKIDSKDTSFWIGHLESWIKATYKRDEQWLLVPRSCMHDSQCDMWQYFESAYNNGSKSAMITPGTPWQDKIPRYRGSYAATYLRQIEQALWALGYIAEKYHVDEKTRYNDLLFNHEE